MTNFICFFLINDDNKNRKSGPCVLCVFIFNEEEEQEENISSFCGSVAFQHELQIIFLLMKTIEVKEESFFV